MSTKEVVMTEEWNESDDFKRVGTEGLSGEDIGEKSLTYWADVWRRFRENKLIECQNSRKSSPDRSAPVYRTNGHRTGLSADRCVDQESGTKQCTLVWYR